MNKSLLVIVLVISILSACGGGAGGSPAVVLPPVAATPTIAFANTTITASVKTPFTLAWSTTNATSCTGSGSLSGTVATAGSQSFTPTSTGIQSYTLTCGTATATATVKVLPEYTMIPDQNFEKALVGMGIDDVLDGQVLTASALKTTRMTISKDDYAPPEGGLHFGTGVNPLITNASGLENFINLLSLRFEKQLVTNFDLTGMTKLTSLSLWNEPLTSIDLSKNIALTILGISETPLRTVDISKLVNLTEAALQQNSDLTLPYTTQNGVVVNGFASLDFTNNTKLQRIYVDGNALTALDLTKNKVLTELHATFNKLQSVNLSNYSAISYVLVNNNNLNYLNIAGTSNNGIPFRLYANNNPNLKQIIVTDAVALLAANVASMKANPGTVGYVIDPQTTYVTGQ